LRSFLDFYFIIFNEKGKNNRFFFGWYRKGGNFVRKINKHFSKWKSKQNSSK